ncbi:hypothetical protein [Kouleothrix sp.]|uniref:hypothetical protein n=1 Tax=Kouleothrix sp. TaxID=2779161 RepID=UPI00391C74D1
MQLNNRTYAVRVFAFGRAVPFMDGAEILAQSAKISAQKKAKYHGSVISGIDLPAKSTGARMIYTITPNPALDRTLTVPAIVFDEMVRASESRWTLTARV